MVRPHEKMELINFPLFTSTPWEEQLAQRIVECRRFTETCDFRMTPLLRLTRIGPVLFALLFRPFDLLGGHHNHPGILLPHHVPKINNRIWQTSLRRYIRLRYEIVVFPCKRCECGEVAANRRERLGSFVLVVVSSTRIDGTLNAQFIQQLTIATFAMVIADRCIRRAKVVDWEVCHWIQVGILIQLQRSNVVCVDVLSTGYWTIHIA